MRQIEAVESKQLMVEEKHETALVSMTPELSVGFGCESAVGEKGDSLFEQPSLQGQGNAGQWPPSGFGRLESRPGNMSLPSQAMGQRARG